MTEQTALNRREKAILRAVRDGRAELCCAARCPDLLVDGCWCDLVATRHLVVEGLIAPTRQAPGGERVPAVLTRLGELILGLPQTA